jgi:hypothetical protein
MWRVAARCIVLAVGFSLAACLPNLRGVLAPTALPTSSAEAAASVQPTAVQPETAGPVPLQTFTPVVALTFTPIPTLTATTGAALTPTSTSPGATASPPQPLSTATPAESISLDKLPPGTIYKPVRIQNQTHSQMDISLQCTTIHGLHTVLEYENVRNLTAQAPEGDYIYVVYVGGRPMSGSFSLLRVASVTITVYADKVTIH